MQKLDHDHYTKIKKIPGGAYGKIYIYKCEKPINQKHIFPWISKPPLIQTNPQYVVIKKFQPLKKQRGLDIDSLREVRLMKSIKHVNIIDVKQIFLKPSKKKNEDNFGSICFVYDQLVSLHNLIYKDVPEQWNEQDIKKTMYQILNGLQALHSKMILHRDFKPDNILLAEDGTLKITDFGLARLWSDKLMTKQVCTIEYRAPELYFGAFRYGPAIDLWSAGCIFAELYLKKPLFQGDTPVKVLANIVNILGNPTTNNWPGYDQLPDVIEFQKREPINLQKLLPKMSQNGVDLLKNLIVWDPNKRMTAQEALQHTYFQDMEQPYNQYSQKIMTSIQNILN